MLLKNHFSYEPPQGYLDTLWPSVSEQVDEGAGASADEVLVFKSSPAMDVLRIPQKQPEPEPVTEAAPARPAPEEMGSPWRWPVALIVSTAIATVGFLAYKKMSPPPTPLASAPPPAAAPAGAPAPASQPVAAALADAGMKLAHLALGDGGAGNVSASTGDEPDKGETGDESGKGEADKGQGGASHARAGHHRGRRHARAKQGTGADKTAAGQQPAKVAAKPAAKEPEDKPAAAKPAVASKTPAKPGKPGTLDSLLDDAIGPGGKVVTKKEESKAPASDLPSQLTMAQIRDSMNRVKGSVQACYDQYQVEGMANVGFVIKGNGSIANVGIRGKFRGTDTGDCVVKAVKKARFDKFSGKPMTIKNYPFLLQ